MPTPGGTTEAVAPTNRSAAMTANPVLTCRLSDGTTRRLERCDDLGELPHGRRFAARDEAGRRLSVVVARPADPSHRDRFEAMRPLAPYLVGVGEVVDGPDAGAMVLVTDAWGTTLADHLGQADVAALPEGEAAALFTSGVDLLVRLHAAGHGHGDVRPEAIAWIEGRGWSLLPGEPSGAEATLADDLAAFARVLRQALGQPLPSRWQRVLDASLAPPAHADVAGLRVRPGPRTLFLTWDWPEGALLAAVGLREDRFPVGLADAAYRADCSRGRYDAEGGFALAVPESAERVYLAVFSLWREEDGTFQPSPGTEPGCRWQGPAGLRAATYRVARAGARFLVEVRSAGAVNLPPLVLVGSFDDTPLGRDDGQVLATSDGGPLGPGAALRVAFDRPERRGPVHVRLFCRRDDDAAWLRLDADPPEGIVLR